jgi:NAD(P)-dependent dehydrogenase (short-subunit alcohol dehydrogenase family)
MDLHLKDRVAAITGAGAGIGQAIAKGLAAEGCIVWLLDRDTAAAEKAAAALTAEGARAQSAKLDVTDAKAAVEVCGKIGKLDILVNAAGLLSMGLVADLPAGEWQRVSDVNVAGTLNCVKAVMTGMVQRRSGRIINIGSVSAARGGGSVGNAIYGATKASVAALTMGLARELGSYGVTVNALAPAIADTAMTRAALTEEARKRILTRIPLGRLAMPSDIADLAVFIASDRAAFITGAVIPVDGGILTT